VTKGGDTERQPPPAGPVVALVRGQPGRSDSRRPDDADRLTRPRRRCPKTRRVAVEAVAEGQPSRPRRGADTGPGDAAAGNVRPRLRAGEAGRCQMTGPATLSTRPATAEDVLTVLKDIAVQDGATPTQVDGVGDNTPLRDALLVCAADPLIGGFDAYVLILSLPAYSNVISILILSSTRCR